MSLPPLPLVPNDEGPPAFLIDNSTLETLQTCTRAMQYQYLQRRVPAFTRSALHFGASLHHAIAVRYYFGADRLSPSQTAFVHDALAEHYAKEEPSLDDFRTLELAHRVIDGYLQAYPIEPFRLVGKPESSFLLPLGALPYGRNQTIPVYYMGRIDLQVEDHEGKWVVDHKTTSMYGETFWNEMSMSAQQIGYTWAHSRCFNELPRGYIINAIRLRRPTKADEYSIEKGVRSDDFSRQRFYVSEETVDEWRENVLALVAEFFWHHSRNYMPKKTKWCVGKYGRCPYFDVCSLPKSSREELLVSNLYTDNNWTPLNKKPI